MPRVDVGVLAVELIATYYNLGSLPDCIVQHQPARPAAGRSTPDGTLLLGAVRVCGCLGTDLLTTGLSRNLQGPKKQQPYSMHHDY